MKYSNSIEYNISTKLDSKGLTQLKTELQSLELKLQNMGNKGLLDEKTFVDARTQIQGLGNALTEAFNPSLGMLNLAKFNQELKDNGVTAQGLKSAFGQMGAEGQVAFNNLVKEVGKLDAGILRTSSSIDKIFVTFSNTFRWGLISSFFSQFMNAIHSSVQYAKDLDDSLTQIMLVTDYSRDSMNEYARAANEAAKAVGQTTVGMTNASLIFAQQGYDLDQSQQLATLSAKLANASQQDTAATSDQITAYMNAYGLQDSMDELVQAMDNWAKIANISAADVEEIALASQRAASMANAVGVSGEALAAQIATIESVTREAPEQIGNGLKTLYARFSDLKLGKNDEDGIGLGKVTSTLQQIGVQVLDAFGNVRDMDDIMEDLMVVWEDLDDTSKTAAAQALAGKHQVNRFMALMENADMYREYKGATGSNASGTLEEMNAEYLDSWQGRMTKLQASLEGLFNTVFDTDAIYPWIDAVQSAVDLLQKFFDALGGGQTVLLGLRSILIQVFSKNIAQQINNASTNLKVQNQKRENLQNAGAALTNLGAVNPNPQDQNSQNIINFARYMNENAQNWNTEQINQANAIMQELVQNSNAATLAAGELKDKLSVIGTAITATTGESILAPFLDDEGAINATLISEAFSTMSSSQIDDLFKQLQDDIKPSKDALLEFNKALQNYQKELRSTDSTDDSFQNSIKQLESALDNLKGKIDDSTYERYSEAIEEISQVMPNAKEKTAETTAEVAKLAENLDKVASKDLTNLESLNNAAFKAKNTAGAAAGSEKIVDKFQEGMDSQAHIQNILNTLNAVQQLAFAWQAFQNLGSLWANEDLSTGEKVLQTILNLTMALPQLIHGLQALNNTEIFNVFYHFEEEINSIQKLTAAGNLAQQALDKIGDGLQTTASAGAQASKEMLKELNEAVEAGDAAKLSFGGVSGVIGKAMATAAAEGATGLGILAAGFKAAAAEAWAFVTGPAAPFLIAGAAIAAIAVAIGVAQEQAKEAHDQAINDLEEAKQARQEAEDFISEVDNWRSKRKEKGDNKELAQEADTLTDSLREMGLVEEANAVHLAAIRAEASGAAVDFNNLEDAVTRAQQAMSDQSALEVMNAANAVLEDRLSTEEEIAAAQEARQNAALDYNLSQLSRTNGWEMGVLNLTGDEDLRAATLDWQSLNSILEESVPGFRDITDENERLALALAHTTDEAQRAAIEIQQILNANDALSSSRTIDYGAGDIGNFNEREDIVQQLENTGLSAEQSLQLLVAVDDSSYETMTQDIQTVMEHLNNGEPFNVAVKAIMDEQETEDYVRSQLAEYEPTDKDVDTDEFKSMANYIQGADDSAFEEGGMFEDIAPAIREDAEAIEDLVEGILRYDDAVSTLQDKEDEWRDALSDTADFQDRANAVEELKETYSDFLDLGDDISDQFAENADNLDLMARAAEGDLEAYNELLAAAATDIAINVYGVDESSAALADMAAYLQSDAFSDIEVGMNIEDEAFYDALNRLAAEAGWTADDLNAYLNSIDCSIDPSGFEETANDLIAAADETGASEAEALSVHTTTTVESGTGHEENTVDYTNATANVTEVTGYSSLPVASGMTDISGMGAAGTPTTARIPYSVPSVSYTVTPVSKTDIAEKTGFAVNQDAKQGSGGKGGVQVKPGSVKKTGSGGSKNRGSSAPRSSGGGKGGGGSCFAAGTLVSLQNQFKNIEDIQIGDIVLSYNEEIHQNEYSIVLQTMIHDVTEEIYDLYIKDEILTVTGIHRFYVRRKHDIEWIPASDLCIGDYVLFADGNWHPVFKIKVKIRSLLVYNFEVSHNHNYYVGHNQILAHNKGGGGGGGSAKTIQPKEKKEHKKDYYERVNSQLDKLKEQLSGIEKQEDRLIGSKARANQQKQIKLIEREIELEKERLEILQSAKENELADVKALMEAKEGAAEEILKAQKIAVTDLPSPDYDAEGIITNYEEISRAIDERHNDLIEKYNIAAAAGNEELTKTIDEAIKKYDDYSAAILENAKRQNDIQKEIESTKNTIQELSDSIEDINIEIYKVSLEAIENLKDLNEVHAEFAGFLSGFKSDSPLRALIEDLDELNNSYAVSADRVQEFYSTLIAEKEKAKESADDDEKAVIDKEIEYFQKKINEAAAGTETELWANGEVGYYLEALRELRKWMNGEEDEDSPNIFGNNTKALYETYLDVYKKTKESALDYEKMVEDTVGDIIDIYDEVADKQEEYLKSYEHWVEKFEKFKDMYTLAYGEESYAAISALEKKQGEILQAQTQRQQEIYNYWAAQYAEAIKEGSGVSQEVKDAIKEHMQEAEEALWDLGQEAGETFVQAYEDAVKGAVQKLNSQVLPEGDSDFNRIDREWEWAKEFVDNYKDEVEKTFEVEKLRNKYADLLNEAQGSSLATQNKIRKQMEEQLKLLEDEEHMSQFDIDLANSKLLILQKQIALEDAQRNKNQMQLRRDSQGNYRYVYRASQNDIAKARQEYLEAIEEGYELSKRHATDTAEKLEATLKKFSEDWENLNTDMNISDEKRQEQSIKLMNDFIEYMDYLAEDFGEGQDGLTNILNEMVMNSTESTAKAAQLMLSNLFDNTSNLLDAEDRAWWDYANALSEIFSKINKDNRTLVEELASTTNGEMDDLRNNLTGNNGVLSVIGKEINSEDGYNSAVQNATAAIKDLNIQTQDLLTEGLQPFNDAITKNINDIISWESTLADARTTLEELEEDYKRISQIMGEDAAAKNTINIPETPPSTTTPSNNTTTTTAKPAAKPATNTNKLNKDRVLAAYNEIMSGRAGNGDARWRYLTNKGYTNAEQDAAQAVVNAVYGGSSKDAALKRIIGYASGGYTGEWNNNGKLAILHQKELVLNAEDTRNILSAVDIVRQMTSTLGNALTNYSIGGARNSLMNTGFGTVDQRVEIKAEFPNVRDAFEIETALTNLADTAYQYAHRKI